ncbi:class I SAM-dependent methyltransferase [Rhodococcus oxybenzonivorans]|uniref:class I SAM-dependent methyltransferase n=1 Tax=Rhodococcus oxybenzonivorans TaxID=1990687 RepID=UPI0029540D79|nr:class I SAM-dependent methyltransferase [Rhodococcus oxybenzonivorans]MDV7354479.1 class I SAM-dependent methyltransferase [Rhodococcus oxybenzonivorans]
MTSQRNVWEHLGATDADWAVASRPERRNGAWADDLDEFYASGARRIDEVLDRLPEQAQRASVLDYGSGTGRLSFALAARFDRVTSADISTSMIALLEKRAAERGITNISTVDLNAGDPPANHDLAISLITLQHVQTFETVDRALRTISASLHPGGYAVIDFPTPPATLRRRVQPSYRAYRWLRAVGVSTPRLDKLGLSGISMLYEAPEPFEKRLLAAGLRTLGVSLDDQAYSVQGTYVTQRVVPE